MAKTAKKGLIVDFTGVEKSGGGGRFRVPEGDYPFKIDKVEHKDSKAGNPMFVIHFEGTTGKVKGKKIRDYFPLQTNALWKLRQVLEAIGMEVPSKKMRLDTDAMVGEEIIITLSDDEYEGKISSKPSDYASTEDVAPSDDDDDDEADENLEDDDDDEDDDI